MKLVQIVVLSLFVLAAARAEEVEVIQLKYRSAEEVVPMLQPLVSPGSTVSGVQNTLMIRTTRGNLEQLRQVIATLDRSPRRLLISVRQDTAGTIEQRGASVSGTVAGGDVRVGANEPVQQESRASVSAFETRAIRDDRVTSQVQALEGSPAYITTGQVVPVPDTTVVTRWPIGRSVQSTTTYQNLSNGFYVVPRVAGDCVFLDITSHSASPGHYGPGSANVQQTVNTVSGRLGEWFPLAGVEQSAARSQSGILYGTSGARSGTSSVWVKVDELQ